MITYQCLRCRSEWIPRKDNPKKCPKCNSPYWNKKRKKEISENRAEDTCQT